MAQVGLLLSTLRLCYLFDRLLILVSVLAPQTPSGIFGIPLNVSIKYANVAISLTGDDGKSFIYGYVPIVVAKCGVFLKEKGVVYIAPFAFSFFTSISILILAFLSGVNVLTVGKQPMWRESSD